MKQFIIKLPKGEKLTDLSEAAQEAVQAVNGQFPSGRVVGSHAVDGYELKLIMCNSTGSQLQDIFDTGFPSADENGEPTLIDLGLDWEVLAEEGTEINENLILPYLDYDIIYDEDGEILSSESKTDLTSLQTYAGKKWT